MTWGTRYGRSEGAGRWAARGDPCRVVTKEGQPDAPRCPGLAGGRDVFLIAPVHPGAQQVHRGKREKRGPVDLKGRNKSLFTESIGKATRKAGKVGVFRIKVNT